MKLVPREWPWPRVSYDYRWIPLLATKQMLPLVTEKMVSVQHSAFSVLEFSKTFSVIMVQRAFQLHYGIDPPLAKNIRHWYKQFKETGCLYKGKSPGRPRTSEEHVHRIQEAFQRSPRKSTCCASREHTIPHVTVWRVLRRRVLMKPYRLQLVQALRVGDRRKQTDFCDMLLEDLEDDTSLPRLIFSDEAMFHLNSKVSHHNVYIWGLENPHEIVQHECDSPKINVFSVVSVRKIYGPFFFEGNTVTGNPYFEMLQDWLFPQLNEDSEDFIFQQDRVPPHWHNQVHRFLNTLGPQDPQT